MNGALNQQINGNDKWCLTPFPYGGALGKGTSWYLFEQHSQAIPYSALGINPCGRR